MLGWQKYPALSFKNFEMDISQARKYKNPTVLGQGRPELSHHYFGSIPPPSFSQDL